MWGRHTQRQDMQSNPLAKRYKKNKLLHRNLLKPLEGVAITEVSLHFNQPLLSSSLTWAQYCPACKVPEWLMVAFKVNSLYRHACSAAEISSLKVSEQQFTLMLFFITASSKLS